MPRELVRAIIGGEEYTFGYLYTTAALEVATEVGLSILPALGKAIPKSGKISDLLEQDLGGLDLGGAFETLSHNMEPKKLSRLVQTLCAVVTSPVGLLEGQNFEDHFKGRTGDALKVAIKSFSVNCGDFFASVVGASGLLKKAATTPAQTPK